MFIPRVSIVHHFSYKGGEVEKVTEHDRTGEELHYHQHCYFPWNLHHTQDESLQPYTTFFFWGGGQIICWVSIRNENVVEIFEFSIFGKSNEIELV